MTSKNMLDDILDLKLRFEEFKIRLEVFHCRYEGELAPLPKFKRETEDLESGFNQAIRFLKERITKKET